MNRQILRMQWQVVATRTASNIETDVDGLPLRILLVDDDEDDYVITRDLLAEIKEDRFSIDWVDSYEAALTAIKNDAHDVYLIDYRLGGHNGLELLSKAIEMGCTAPLILLTGQGDRSVDVEAMKRGAADYLVKDQIDAPMLERSIRYAVERKLAEQTLRGSEHFIRTIISSVGEGIIGYDRELRCQIWNKFMENLTGLPEEKVVGRSATELFAHPHEPGKSQPLERVLAGEIVRPPDTPYHISETGKQGWLVAVYSPHIAPNGEIIGVVATIRDITERKQAEEAIQRLAEQRKRLLEVSQTILSTLTLTEIVDQVQQAFEGILKYDACGLYWLEPEESLLRPSQGWGRGWVSDNLQDEPIPLGKGITSLALHSEKGELVNKAHLDPRSFYPEGAQVACEHLISIPIRTKEKTLGVFNMSRRTDPPFTNEEFELVQLFIAQATNAIENAYLHAETEKRAQQLAVLHELDRAITTSLRITDIYHAFTRHAIRLLPYDRTSITLLDQNKLRLTYVAGEDKPLPHLGATLSCQNSIPGRVVNQGQPSIHHNMAVRGDSPEDKALWGEGIQSSMIIPLRVKGQVIGTWNLGSRQTGSYNPDDLDIAQSMADQLAIAIENARLFQQAKQEIAERKRIEEAPRASEVKYRTLIERMSEGLLQVDNDDIIQFVNDRFCEMVGYSRNELLGKPASELRLQEKIAKNHLQAQDSFDQYETQLMKKSGEMLWVQVGGAPVLDAEGKIIGSVRIHTDITERKRAEETRAKLEEQLRQSQKMEAVGTLAGGIAHDFNNLLTAIMGYSGLALDTLSPDNPTYNDIQGIQKTAERAANLTRQLLAFARRQMIELRVLNLNELILNMGKMLHRLIGEDIELVTIPTPNLGLVKIDPGQFEQVLVNLAINARDAMPNGGKLTIETANVTLDWPYAQQHAEVVPGEYIMLAVSDNGVGMTEEVQDHIFEPFFTTKEVNKGTGLGLATCFGIVKQSDGHIWVYSEPGKGTTFKVYLPRILEPETASPFKHNAFSDLPRGKETVLLVEDEFAVRDLAARMLRQQGYKLLEAANGHEALRLAQKMSEEKIDLLVTDVIMPRLGGRDLAHRLKATHPSLKVLFTSGYADNAIVHHGVLEPGLAFLQKPFSPEMLVRKVREVLDEGQG
ncbi:MAG: PAS domain S-box protein [Anaerolineae bacterium]|nr:PAS domain S-box protein [Anaerolineae bacterium]